MLQGPIRTWEGQTGKMGRDAGSTWGKFRRKKVVAGWHSGQVPAWPLVVVPTSCKVFLSPSKSSESRSLLSVPSLGRATRHYQVAETTRPKWGEASVHAIPATPILTVPSPSACLYPGPPPPWPISFSVLISQSCTRRELSMGGWFFGFCLFVCLI